MTEVRVVSSRSTSNNKSSRNRGLFASKEYEPGDVVLVEDEPLARLAPVVRQQERFLRAELVRKGGGGGGGFDSGGGQAEARAGLKDDGGKEKAHPAGEMSFWDSIEVPTSSSAGDVDGGVPEEYRGTYRGMVQAAVCYAVQRNGLTPECRRKLFELYRPAVKDEEGAEDDEKAVLKVARIALQELKRTARKGSKVEKLLEASEQELLDVMLIWACNAFEGGRVYDTISRINHSCDPNAIVQVGQQSQGGSKNAARECQVVRAAARIQVGDEINISYLGTLLYADRSARRRVLRRTKHFACQCSRCCYVATAGAGGGADGNEDESDDDVTIRNRDVAASIPCLFCHPRVTGRMQLDEDVQYDDEQTVHYMSPVLSPPPPSTTSDEAGDNGSWSAYKCEACLQTFPSSARPTSASATNPTAPEPDDEDMGQVFRGVESVADKVLKLFQDRQGQERASSNGNDDDQDDGEKLEQRLVMEDHLREACIVFLGARHWATNLMLLLKLDQSLQEYHGALLAQSTGDDDSGGDGGQPDMERVAEMVDLLQRLYRFVDGLGLKLHAGHILSDVTIGVARALVGLGDVKSQKYGAEWLDKIADDYVNIFESEGMRKVVATLRVSWKREGDGDEDAKPPSKRLKTS